MHCTYKNNNCDEIVLKDMPRQQFVFENVTGYVGQFLPPTSLWIYKKAAATFFLHHQKLSANLQSADYNDLLRLSNNT